MKKWREEMKKIYEEILAIEPTYEQIKAFAEAYSKQHGVVTYTKRSDNPLSIRLQDTWGVKRQGRLHIDIVSGKFHLTLNKYYAPEFLRTVKETEKNKK